MVPGTCKLNNHLRSAFAFPPATKEQMKTNLGLIAREGPPSLLIRFCRAPLFDDFFVSLPGSSNELWTLFIKDLTFFDVGWFGPCTWHDNLFRSSRSICASSNFVASTKARAKIIPNLTTLGEPSSFIFSYWSLQSCSRISLFDGFTSVPYSIASAFAIFNWT